MKVAICLGNRINDDGSFTEIMVKRLELVTELYESKGCDKIICSGGVANPKVSFSEAEMMKKYLVSLGINESDIYTEDKSMTTKENAQYSVPIALELGANTIIIVSTSEHFYKYSYNPIKYFLENIRDKNIKLMIYTDGGYNEDV